jgi:hypothetical protein
MSPSQATEFEAISSLRSEGIAYATHRCRKLRMGEVDYNPDLNILRNRILAWNLQISKLQGCRVDSRYLQRSIVSADLPLGSFSLSLPKAILAQKANFKACRLAKKTHVSARVAWLRSLSLARSEEDGKSATNHYSTLVAIEQQRRQARNVKRATHKLKSFGTSRIIAPDSDGEWVEHTSKEDIEAGCQ